MTALHAVFAEHGLPVALYTDRAGWAFHTPQAGGRVDRECPKKDPKPSDHDGRIADHFAQRKIVATDEFLEGTP